MKWIVIALLLAGMASAACTELTDGSTITQSTLLCGDTFDVPSGIKITASNLVLDCGTGVLRGTQGASEIGIKVENADNITIRNCNILTFDQGLFLINVTNSLIEDNGFLKNRIGVRMLSSYENTIRNNNDKSFQLAVSAITSKYNIVMLGNKNVERAFCEVNSCNEVHDMNVCEAGDFYCSKKCTPAADADCAGPPPVEKKEPVKTADQIIEEAKKEVEQNIVEVPVKASVEKPKLNFVIKALIYIALYCMAFIVIHRKKK